MPNSYLKTLYSQERKIVLLPNSPQFFFKLCISERSTVLKLSLVCILFEIVASNFWRSYPIRLKMVGILRCIYGLPVFWYLFANSSKPLCCRGLLDVLWRQLEVGSEPMFRKTIHRTYMYEKCVFKYKFTISPWHAQCISPPKASHVVYTFREISTAIRVPGPLAYAKEVCLHIVDEEDRLQRLSGAGEEVKRARRF